MPFGFPMHWLMSAPLRACYAAAPRSYQLHDPFTILTTDSITGTSTSTPKTVVMQGRPN
jgi:hypothetical protein